MKNLTVFSTLIMRASWTKPRAGLLTAIGAGALITISGCASVSETLPGSQMSKKAAPSYSSERAVRPEERSDVRADSRPAARPVIYAQPKVEIGKKQSYRSQAGPRPIIPCFGDNPLRSVCRGDSALNLSDDVGQIREASSARKTKPVNNFD